MLNSKFVYLRMMGVQDPFMPMCNGKGGGDAPDPDPNIGVAALKNAEIGKEALDWYKGIYAQDAPYREELRALSNELTKSQVAAATQNQNIANDYYSYMNKTYRPIEESLAKDATTYSSAAEQEKQAAAAAADIASASANQRAQMNRAMAASGVNPNSGRFASLQNDASILESATRAGAMTKARDNADQLGWAKRMDAASLGKGLASNQVNSQNIAINAGNSAINTAKVPGQTSAQYAGMVGSGYGQAMQGYANMGNILNNQYQTQVSAWNAQQQANAAETGGLMSGLGMAAGMYFASSKELKTDKKQVGSVLEGIRELPVEEWTYKKGVADEGRHIGPYAEDVKEKFGDGAAPGGKMLDVISMIGINTAAIKELDKKVTRLGKR